MKGFKTVSIVGVGLVGGSIGMALRKREMAEKVIGIGRRQTSLRTARRVGAVTNTTVDPAKGVEQADLVIVCTPVGRIVEDVRLVAGHCPKGTLITDAGSTKQTIVEQLDGTLPRGCRFLGSHPLAGGEQSGAAHASADLFEGRVTIITPTKNTNAKDFDLLEEFWTGLGSMVVQLSAEEHDKAVALTSHLPHAAAAVLISLMPENYFRLAGTGLLDTTRIAAGSVDLWKQIFMLNRQNVLAGLEEYRRSLDCLHTAIEAGDEDEIERILSTAKRNRDALGS